MKIQTSTNQSESEPRLDMEVLPLSIDQATEAHRTLRASSARAGSEEKAFACRPEQRIDGEKSIQAGQMQVREMTLMATPAGPRIENAPFRESDKIVRRLDEFPDLNRALRTGDVSTARLLCAQLFHPEGRHALAWAVRSKAS
jgi:hypothetical protein